MGNKTSIHVNRHPSLWEGLGVLLLLLLFAVSCSEQEDVEADDYANWQERNDAYIADIAKRCQRVKSFTKDQQTEGDVSDYVYYEVLETGEGTDSPYYTDTVRISYRGRIIPTASYPEGLVFDQTYTGTFSWQTTGVVTTVASGFVDGFTTILQHMHRGDRWRVYIPYQLGYNKTSKDGNPAICSNLIFDLALVDFSHPDHNLPQWSARQTE
jgi:FKBP-type peptidyl-prolyl cis-trans isomerase FklB